MKEEITWSFEQRKINDLKTDEFNPRKISKNDFNSLKKSIDSFGLCQPVVIQPTGEIINGHQRVKALLAYNFELVDCAVPSRFLDEDERKKLSILLNKAQGEFDFDLLANHWEEDLLLDAGFTEDELQIGPEPEAKPKKMQIVLKFEDKETLEYWEARLENDICNDPNVKIKVKK